MDGVILAAGLGTRLRPLTRDRPKALVEVNQRTLLDRVARRLVAAGVDRLIVNLHPFPEQVRAHIEANAGFGARAVLYSLEEEAPLETGGGLLRAGVHLRPDVPFFVHNVDVLTDLPLEALYGAHEASGALATLAVMERASARGLLFDDEGLLGRVDTRRGIDLRVRAATGPVRRLAFAGVHVVSPALLPRITERGAFSILEPYLRLAGQGETIRPHRVDGCRWQDVGKIETLAEAEALARTLDAQTRSR